MTDEPDRSVEAAQAPPDMRLVSGRVEYQRTVRDALEIAASAGCREMVWVDPDFSDWPIGERHVVDSLSRWAQSHRRLTILAARFDALERSHPRFLAWRRTWSHVVHCREAADTDAPALPSVLLAPGRFTVRLLDPVHFRARFSTSRSDEVHDANEIDAFLQRSHESFPVTRLGL